MHLEPTTLLAVDAVIAMRLLPMYLRGPLLDYVERRIPPDSPFLRAVLQGDWAEARRQADYANTEALPYWRKWMQFHAPDECHGSAQAFADWTAAR